MSDPQPFYRKTEETVKGGRFSKKKGLLIFLGIVAVVVLLTMAAVKLGGVSMSPTKNTHDAPFSSGHEQVAVIHVEGTIATSNSTYNQEWLETTIKNAKFDRDNTGIALVINSPGGAVYESDETYLLLKEYQKETGRPVYAYMKNLAASGGYYIAAPADKIFANRNTLTGSIGVIGSQSFDVTAFMEKHGIKVEVVHSGANKTMGSPFTPMTEEQRAIWQSLSDEAYEQFVGIVAEGRGMSVEAVKALADGRIYTANQAKANGLIDDVASYEAFKKAMREDNGMAEQITFKDHKYTAPKSWSSLLSQSPLNKLFGMPQGEVAATLSILEGLNVNEPMYLYL